MELELALPIEVIKKIAVATNPMVKITRPPCVYCVNNNLPAVDVHYIPQCMCANIIALDCPDYLAIHSTCKQLWAEKDTKLTHASFSLKVDCYHRNFGTELQIVISYYTQFKGFISSVDNRAIPLDEVIAEFIKVRMARKKVARIGLFDSVSKRYDTQLLFYPR
jgi:hypothetical protein